MLNLTTQMSLVIILNKIIYICHRQMHTLFYVPVHCIGFCVILQLHVLLKNVVIKSIC